MFPTYSSFPFGFTIWADPAIHFHRGNKHGYKSTWEEHGLPSLALVFGYIAIKELGNLAERIKVLDRLGYGNEEIAKICAKTPNSIRAITSKLGKTDQSRGRK